VDNRLFLRIDYYVKIIYMAKVKRKFKNLILLLLLLIAWTVVGLLGRVTSDKISIFSIKEAQGACCPCAPEPACDGCDVGSIEGSGGPSCSCTTDMLA
jgi:hypothetical protein